MHPRTDEERIVDCAILLREDGGFRPIVTEVLVRSWPDRVRFEIHKGPLLLPAVIESDNTEPAPQLVRRFLGELS